MIRRGATVAIAVQPWLRTTSGAPLAALLQRVRESNPFQVVCLRPDACGDRLSDPQEVADSIALSTAWWRRNRDLTHDVPHLSLRTSVLHDDYWQHKQALLAHLPHLQGENVRYQVAALSHMICRRTLPRGTQVVHPRTACDGALRRAVAAAGGEYVALDVGGRVAGVAGAGVGFCTE